MSESVIKIKNLSKSFCNKEVLKNVSFDIKKGSVVGLLGRNGVGKTTLIKSMLGLIKYDKGQIEIFGEKPEELSVEVKHRIGYVPQVNSSMQWMTVNGLLDYIGAFYRNWDRKKINELLKMWDINDEEKVANLSVGEKQKLMIIQTMGFSPDLFILDEPVASLDPSSRRQFIKQLIELNANDDKTILFSTHIMSDLERIASEIILIKSGKIKFKGDLSRLKETVFRLRILSKNDLENIPTNKKIIHFSKKGKSAVATVNGMNEDEIDSLRKELSAMIDVEYLNLEEIFLELDR